MANVKNMHAGIMNEPGGGNSSSSAIYENPNAFNVDPLEVNRLNPNLVVLSDSSESSEDSIQMGDESFSASIKGNTNKSSKEGKETNSSNLI